jgi:tRNA threonylcarbamoyladenosine dehydratase
VATLLDSDAQVVIDACDQVRAKAAMAGLARDRGQCLIVCGAAGGRIDAMALADEDIALIKGDALLASLRAKMRRDYGFSRVPGERFGVRAVYSQERLELTSGSSRLTSSAPGSPLACSGYGSMVTVTAAFGMAAAGMALKHVLNLKVKDKQ